MSLCAFRTYPCCINHHNGLILKFQVLDKCFDRVKVGRCLFPDIVCDISATAPTHTLAIFFTRQRSYHSVHVSTLRLGVLPSLKLAYLFSACWTNFHSPDNNSWCYFQYVHYLSSVSGWDSLPSFNLRKALHIDTDGVRKLLLFHFPVFSGLYVLP